MLDVLNLPTPGNHSSVQPDHDWFGRRLIILGFEGFLCRFVPGDRCLIKGVPYSIAQVSYRMYSRFFSSLPFMFSLNVFRAE